MHESSESISELDLESDIAIGHLYQYSLELTALISQEIERRGLSIDSFGEPITSRLHAAIADKRCLSFIEVAFIAESLRISLSGLLALQIRPSPRNAFLLSPSELNAPMDFYQAAMKQCEM